jgi:type I restriction enzyme S subunit
VIDTLKPTGSSPNYLVRSEWPVERLWRVARLRSEKNRPDLPLLSVFLGRGVIAYGEGGGQVHKPGLDLTVYQVVRQGDLVLNNQQAWRGSVGVSRHTGIISPAYVVLELQKAIEPRFADYLFQSRVMVDQFVTSSKGVGDIQRDIHIPWLKNARVPLPPAEEQTGIVRFLDHAHAKVERAVRAKRKLIALLNEQKQAIIHRAVTRGLDPAVKLKPSGIPWLGDVPEHWGVMLNQRIFKEQVRAHNGEPETPLSLSQRSGLIATSQMQERSLKTASYENWKVVTPGDLVLNRFKAHLGVFFEATMRGIVSFHYGVFAPRRPLITKYYELLYHTHPYRAIYAGQSNGMTVGLQNLSNQNFYNVRSVLPPQREQSEIVQFAQHATAQQNTTISRAEREIELLREYRTTLTAAVVTGKLDVRDAAKGLPASADLLPSEDGPDDDDEPDEADE